MVYPKTTICIPDAERLRGTDSGLGQVSGQNSPVSPTPTPPRETPASGGRMRGRSGYRSWAADLIRRACAFCRRPGGSAASWDADKATGHLAPLGASGTVFAAFPSRRERETILRHATPRARVAPDADLGLLARMTSGFGRTELLKLSNEAARRVVQDGRDAITIADLEAALDWVLLTGGQLLLPEPDDLLVAAYHAAGHALAAWLTPGAGHISGATVFTHACLFVEGEACNASGSGLLARLDVLLAGPAAEEVSGNTLGPDAGDDLLVATSLARQILANSPTAPATGPEQEPAAALVTARFTAACDLLTSAEDKLHIMADLLIQEETIDRSALTRVLGPRPTQSRAA